MRVKQRLKQKGKQEVNKAGFLSKKAQVIQVAYFLIVLLAVALTILTMKYIINEFHDGVNEAGYNTTTIEQVESNIVTGWEMSDYGFVIVTIGLFIGLIISSFMIPTHPVFFVVNVFGIIFLVFLGMITSNFYGEIVAGDDAVFAEEAETFELMNFIMSYLPYIAAGIIFITSIVMYVRGSSTPQYG